VAPDFPTRGCDRRSASKDAWSAERPRGAFTVIRNPCRRRDRQEREGSVWWSAVVGAINFDGLIVLDIAIELFGRR
jgi:hypothetical protein